MRMKISLIRIQVSMILFITLISTSPVRGQESVSPARSAVRVTVPKEAVTAVSQITPANSLSVSQYSDGLGRAHMQVAHRITPTGKDLVTMSSLDETGAVSQQWLPVPVTASENAPVPATVMQQAPAAHLNDTHPYRQYRYSQNRTGEGYPWLEETPEGKDWHNRGKKQKIEYFVNTGSDPEWADIFRFRIATNNRALWNDGNYPQGALTAAIFTDEDGKEEILFQDAQGKTILQRKVFNKAGRVYYDTYHVYDDRGNLRYVLPPEASARMKEDTVYRDTGPAISLYAYQYRYDGWDRCTQKKLPQAEWISYVYDQSGRVVLTQDGNQLQKNQWSLTVYDVYGRTIQEGILTSTGNYTYQIILANYFADRTVTESWTGSGYTDTQLYPGTKKILNTYYYDTYEFLDLPAYASIRSQLLYATSTGYGTKGSRTENGVEILTRGLATGTATSLLTEDTTRVILEALYYDNRGRVILRKANNHIDGMEASKYAYNFNNSVQKEEHSHKHPDTSLLHRMEYLHSYDRAGRLTASRQNAMGTKGDSSIGTPVADSLEYNELGQVKRRLFNNGRYPIGYAYNIRGQVTRIMSNDFDQTIDYQFNQAGGESFFNGNVSHVLDRFSNPVTEYPQIDHSYRYDGINRLSEATINVQDATNWDQGPCYYHTRYSYDRNGNMTRLDRSGPLEYMGNGYTERFYYFIDQLQMTYQGNRLVQVVDDVDRSYEQLGNHDFRQKQPPRNLYDAYGYDANGNLMSDYNKGIAWVQYNDVNRPAKIQMVNGDKTTYIYDAMGNKRRAKYLVALNEMQIPIAATGIENTTNIRSSTTRDYVGRFIYKDGAIDKILTPNGYIVRGDVVVNRVNNWTQVYQLTDYLGNVRAEITMGSIGTQATAPLTLRSYSAYYPFGTEMVMPTGESPAIQPYQLSGNERERTNTDWHDFHHRWYDQQLGRFLSMDPLAELDYSVSPYAYCRNNPVNLVDPWGLAPQDDDQYIDGGELDEVVVKGKRKPKGEDNGIGYYSVGGGPGWGSGIPGIDGRSPNRPLTWLEQQYLLFLESMKLMDSQSITFGFFSKSKDLQQRGDMVMYKDIETGLQKIWEASLKYKREMAGYYTKKGLIGAWDSDSKENSTKFRTIEKNGKNYIKYGGKTYEVEGLVHTHPRSYPEGIGISNKDIKAYEFYSTNPTIINNFNIINDGNLYQMDGPSKTSYKLRGSIYHE